MPRTFNGTTDEITTAVGGLAAYNFGTMAAICRRANDNNWHGICVTLQSGTTPEVYLDIAPSSHATAGAIWSSYGGTDNSGTLKFLAADGWCLVAVSKATGSVTPRYHKLVLSTLTWTHQAGGGAVANGTSTPGGNIKLGNVGGDRLEGDLAACAFYARDFSDQEIENLAASWEVWLSYGPAGVWLLDQAATGQAVLDWTGGGANQSAISGTTVTTGSLPGWNQSDGGTWAAEIISGGSSFTAGATLAATATLTAGAVLSAAAAATLTATAALTADMVLAAGASASLTATATLVAVGIRTAVAAASLAATASLIAGASVAAATPATLTAAATLTADATVGTPPVLAAAVLAVSAALTAGVVLTASGGASLVGTATLTAGFVGGYRPAAVLAASAVLTAAAALTASPGAVLTAVATFTAAAAVTGAFTVGSLGATSVAASTLAASSARGGPA